MVYYSNLLKTILKTVSNMSLVERGQMYYLCTLECLKDQYWDLFFVLFINDMHKGVSHDTSIALYANDTKIWREITCDEDQVILQNDINNLYKWSVENKMNFHPSKCKVLAVTNKRLTYSLPFYEFIYMLNGSPLDYAESEKDLGVIINGKLNWSAHCRNSLQMVP